MTTSAAEDAAFAVVLRAAFATGDPAGLASLLSDDVRWHGTESGPWDCHNRNDVLATLRRHHADGVRYQLRSLDRVGQQLRLHLAASYRDPDTGEHHRWTVRQVVTLDAAGRAARIADDSDAAEPATEVQP